MTEIHFALPDRALDPRDFARFRRSFTDNFGAHRVRCTASGDWAARHAGTHGIEVAAAAPADAEHVVGIFDRSLPRRRRSSLAGIERRPGRRHWHFNLSASYLRARLEPADFDDYAELYPELDAHAFNRLGPRNTDRFIYFPYGYMFRMLGLGPLDEFGQRIAGPVDGLADRPRNHRLILFFGGSAAWSLDCLHSEMATHQLESMLNEHAARTGTGQVWTVLNMGQHGNVVLNEMLTYLLHGERLRPDLVIGHDGFNDMIYGTGNDTRLLGRHRIAYQDILEQWPQALHGSAPDGSTYHREAKYALRNTPAAIVRAYVERKAQFERVVRAGGAGFVWGLQPCLGSKAAPHPIEAAYLDADQPLASQFGLAYANAARLLDDAGTAIAALAPEAMVDHHRQFAAWGADELCFADYVHGAPEGDRRMAQAYLEHLVERGLA